MEGAQIIPFRTGPQVGCVKVAGTVGLHEIAQSYEFRHVVNGFEMDSAETGFRAGIRRFQELRKVFRERNDVTGVIRLVGDHISEGRELHGVLQNFAETLVPGSGVESEFIETSGRDADIGGNDPESGQGGQQGTVSKTGHADGVDSHLLQDPVPCIFREITVFPAPYGPVELFGVPFAGNAGNEGDLFCVQHFRSPQETHFQTVGRLPDRPLRKGQCPLPRLRTGKGNGPVHAVENDRFRRDICGAVRIPENMASLRPDIPQPFSRSRMKPDVQKALSALDRQAFSGVVRADLPSIDRIEVQECSGSPGKRLPSEYERNDFRGQRKRQFLLVFRIGRDRFEVRQEGRLIEIEHIVAVGEEKSPFSNPVFIQDKLLSGSHRMQG